MEAIFAVVDTTQAVLKIMPEKIQACMESLNLFQALFSPLLN